RPWSRRRRRGPPRRRSHRARAAARGRRRRSLVPPPTRGSGLRASSGGDVISTGRSDARPHRVSLFSRAASAPSSLPESGRGKRGQPERARERGGGENTREASADGDPVRTGGDGERQEALAARGLARGGGHAVERRGVEGRE